MATETKANPTRQWMQAGFSGGWAAAHVSLAIMAEKQGDAAFGKWLRERALKPDAVEIVELPSEPGATA